MACAAFCCPRRGETPLAPPEGYNRQSFLFCWEVKVYTKSGFAIDCGIARLLHRFFNQNLICHGNYYYCFRLFWPRCTDAGRRYLTTTQPTTERLN